MIKRAPLAALLLLAACASSGSKNVERSFARPGLEQLPLMTVDAFVFVAGPPRAAELDLEVKTFEPPEPDQPLAIGETEEATTRALVERVRADLEARGFKVNVESPLAAALSSTATTATSTTTGLEEGPGARPRAPQQLAQTTLTGLRERSQADAILIVRAVPVDVFNVVFGAGTRIEITALGKERIQDVRPVEHQGRLMVGQMFLFDRKTGLRLWTRQVPDFPDGGRITENHPFLEYGYVAGPTTTAAPDRAQRAAPAAAAFSRKMLEEFPRATIGKEEARAQLDTVDLAGESALQSFFDQGHFVLDASARFQHGPTTMDLELGGAALPELTTGALTPNGVAIFVPRASYVAAGGWTFSVAVPIGVAPGSFRRSYHRDEPNAMTMTGDHNAAVTVSGATLFGIEGSVGPTIVLSPTLYLHPNGGLFFEMLSFDAAPESVVRNTRRSRFGANAGADLWIRASDTSAFFGHVGAALRAGVDFGGSPALAFLLSAGVGVFL